MSIVPSRIFISLQLCCLLILLASCKSEEVAPSTDFRPIITDISDSNSNSGMKDSEFTDLVDAYENEDRQYWQKPKLVINSLGDISDKVVADIGAGTGYFSLRFLPFAKRVIAIDIDPRMTSFMQSAKNDITADFSKNLDVRLAEPDDPKLKRHEADIIFLSNTYVYINDRVNYFNRLLDNLKPNGKLIIVDFKKKRIPVHENPEERLPLHIVEQELLDAGYDVVKTDDQSLPYQYIIEARKVR